MDGDGGSGFRAKEHVRIRDRFALGFHSRTEKKCVVEMHRVNHVELGDVSKQ